jgi:hypothetical protein
MNLHNETNAKLLTIKLEAEADSKNYSRAHSLIIFNTPKNQKQKPRIILLKNRLVTHDECCPVLDFDWNPLVLVSSFLFIWEGTACQSLLT